MTTELQQKIERQKIRVAQGNELESTKVLQIFEDINAILFDFVTRIEHLEQQAGSEYVEPESH